MRVLAIDPGATRSGFVVMQDETVLMHGDIPNEDLLTSIHVSPGRAPMVIEWTKPRGQPASAALFDTLFWAGRFSEAAERAGRAVHRLLGSDVRKHLCGNGSAKDAAVHVVLWDRFGGSMTDAKGTKAKPGPLYGFSGKDEYDALALAVAFMDGVRS